MSLVLSSNISILRTAVATVTAKNSGRLYIAWAYSTPKVITKSIQHLFKTITSKLILMGPEDEG